jgi:hypothetical protein
MWNGRNSSKTSEGKFHYISLLQVLITSVRLDSPEKKKKKNMDISEYK